MHLVKWLLSRKEEKPPAVRAEKIAPRPAFNRRRATASLETDASFTLLLASSLNMRSTRTPDFNLNSRLCDEMAAFTPEDVKERLKRDYWLPELGPSSSRAPLILAMLGMYENLQQAKGMKFLDLAGGSSGSGFFKEPEPWDARFMHECGAEVHLVDIGEQITEKFRTYQRDLTKKGALDTFQPGYFDCIFCLGFTGPDPSPLLERTTDEKIRAHASEGISSQAERLLKEGGCFVTDAAFGVAIFRKSNGKLERDLRF